MGIVIWVILSWVVFIALILRFFSVCKEQRRSVSKPQRRDKELRNKVEANSPYNDGWTREFYKDET